MTDRTEAAQEKAVLEEDIRVLHRMGYAQELARRMHTFSNFAISFSIICILAGGVTSFQLGFSAGGGFSIGVGWLVGGALAMIVAACMGQIASAYPTAGGLYHWSSILGGRLWGWLTAWFNLLGLVFVVASVNVGVYLLGSALILGPMLGIDTSAWGYREQVIAVVAITFTQALFNTFGIRVTTFLTDLSGYLILAIAILLTLVMLINAPSFDVARLFTFVNNTGDPGGGVFPRTESFWMVVGLGLLLPLYTLTGYDASAHTSEETLDARRAVPKGMLNSVFISLVFGYLMTCAFVLAMPDTTLAATNGANVFFKLLEGLALPVWLQDVLYIGIVAANYLCALAGLTSFSRMIFAFARDGGLPFSHTLRHVSRTFRTPIPAIWTAAILAVAATLYSPAFAALAAGCAVFLYVSYAMPIAAGLLAEGRSWTEFGPFRLGLLSRPLALISVLGVGVLAFVGLQPPNDILITYGLGLLVVLAVAWFTSERKRFHGPPIGAEIAQRQDEIRAEEAAVGETAVVTSA